MSILINKNTKVICQGITGREGTYHTEQAITYGKKMLATSGLAIVAADDLADAADKITASVKKRAA
jgi:succinyl-CoA synthetase alpha subunit